MDWGHLSLCFLVATGTSTTEQSKCDTASNLASMWTSIGVGVGIEIEIGMCIGIRVAVCIGVGASIAVGIGIGFGIGFGIRIGLGSDCCWCWRCSCCANVVVTIRCVEDGIGIGNASRLLLSVVSVLEMVL